MVVYHRVHVINWSLYQEVPNGHVPLAKNPAMDTISNKGVC